jgi:hypothetical protein
MNYWEVKMSKGKVFAAQEVQAIISGNKKMFREVIKSKPLIKRGDDYLFDDNGKIVSQKDCCPYQVGQKIFCKESFNIFAGQVAYKGNLANAERHFWKPASHMKQEHSRLTLQIKEITVERLQHINEEDCKKEGIGYTGGWNGEDYDDGEFFFGKLVETEDGMNWKNEMFEYADLAFEKYWNSTHKKPKEKFEANPFVWSIQFEVVNE